VGEETARPFAAGTGIPSGIQPAFAGYSGSTIDIWESRQNAGAVREIERRYHGIFEGI
jgi:hypothetical protein